MPDTAENKNVDRLPIIEAVMVDTTRRRFPVMCATRRRRRGRSLEP